MELGVLPWWGIEWLTTILYSVENRIPLFFVELFSLAKVLCVSCLDGAYHHTVLFWGVVTIARGITHLYLFHLLASPFVWVLMERDLNERTSIRLVLLTVRNVYSRDRENERGVLQSVVWIISWLLANKTVYGRDKALSEITSLSLLAVF